MRNPLQFLAEALDWSGPNAAASPEDEAESSPTQGTVSRSGESWSIPVEFLKQLAPNEDKVLARGGAQDLKLYDDLLDDDVAMSAFQQRRLAVVARDWTVAPGNPKDPRSVEAADHLRSQLEQIEWDRICDRMLYSVWFGYGVGETTYRVGPDMKYWLDDIIVPDRNWFAFTRGGELRLKGMFAGLYGEQLPPNKFWTIRTGATHDFAMYGLGLAHWCYWPIWFKRSVIGFWALYLEKLGVPTALGAFDETWNDVEKKDLLSALVAIGRDRAVTVPSNAFEQIKLIESSRSGAAGNGYKDFVTEQNEALMRIILGQPGTSKATPQGVGGSQSEVHADVKAEIVKADSDLLSASFNRGPAKWLTRWNFGEDVAPPRVYRQLEDDEDAANVAERDVNLHGIGIRRTEESVRDVYGDGYQLVDVTPPPAAPPAPGAVPPIAANDAGDDDTAAAFAAQDVAPLYISRPVINGKDLLAWARANKIEGLVDKAELHVTTLYSRTPVDWAEMDNGGWRSDAPRIPPGGFRKLELFDEGGPLVLRFVSEELGYEHARRKDRGASHDYSEFLPHITLSYAPGEIDLEAIEPFNGEIVLGPERFERIRTSPEEVMFSAEDEDAIDRLTAALAAETSPIMKEFGAAIIGRLEGVTNPEGVRIALLQAFEEFPHERMAELAGLPLIAERMAAEAGADADVSA